MNNMTLDDLIIGLHKLRDDGTKGDSDVIMVTTEREYYISLAESQDGSPCIISDETYQEFWS